MSKVDLPKIRDLLKLYHIKPKKGFSQNFLLSSRVCDKFTSGIQSPFDDTLFLEIGTGPGGLSRSFLKRGAQKIVGVERDERFRPILEQLRDMSENRFDFIIADAMQDSNLELTQQVLKLAKIEPKRIVLFGNLPFQIGGKLLSMWNYQCLCRHGIFAVPTVEMRLMFTNDVASRLLAEETKRTQFSAITNIAFKLSMGAVFRSEDFSPSPAANCIALNFTKRQKSYFDGTFC
jgi:16S rRNA A1518/A1519 N6-dimethyltransferase RsmA/KsgA/DIM1 with predicted DNA glycosylase/AP lyase activity